MLQARIFSYPDAPVDTELEHTTEMLLLVNRPIVDVNTYNLDEV